jgi:hypothetical protein
MPSAPCKRLLRAGEHIARPLNCGVGSQPHGRKFLPREDKCHVAKSSTLDPKTSVVWRGERQAVRDLAVRLKLTWRAQLGLRAVALRVYAPKYGHLPLLVTGEVRR